MSYEKLKQVIIEANPKIVELKFGCDISRPYYEYQKGGTIIGQDNGTYYVLYDGLSQVISSEHNIQDNEIIGRPIQLPDVLMACKNKIHLSKPSDGYCTYPCLLIMDDKNTHPRAEWDLSKNLDEQSQECKDFLIKLLITKQ